MELIGKRKQSMTSNHSFDSHKIFFISNQKYLNWFAFFCVFPLIKIGGISITFFIFLVIAYNFLRQKRKLFKITHSTDIFLLLFLLFVSIAALLSEESFRDRSTVSIIKIMVQYIYWVVLALFIKTWIYNFDFYKVSRSIFFATAISVAYYVILNPFYPIFYPNSFAYTLVTAMPLGFYYLVKRLPIQYVLLVLGGVVMGILYSGSRMGTALILMEILLLLSLGNNRFKKGTLLIGGIFIPLLTILFFILNPNLDQTTHSMKNATADILENYSPKIAHTLRMQENVFDRDKGFLQRILMKQKTLKIFDEHPFFGIGPGNFTKYYVTLDIAVVSHWLAGSERRYNTRSAQNSYFLIIAEDGIFAFVSIFIVFLIIIFKGFHFVLSLKDNVEIYIYIPFMALLLYSFILVTTQGALFWFLLGLTLTLTHRNRVIT